MGNLKGQNLGNSVSSFFHRCYSRPVSIETLGVRISSGADLGKADVLRLFSKTLAAEIQAVLPDQTGLMGADAALKSR